MHRGQSWSQFEFSVEAMVRRMQFEMILGLLHLELWSVIRGFDQDRWKWQMNSPTSDWRKQLLKHRNLLWFAIQPKSELKVSQGWWERGFELKGWVLINKEPRTSERKKGIKRKPEKEDPRARAIDAEGRKKLRKRSSSWEYKRRKKRPKGRTTILRKFGSSDTSSFTILHLDLTMRSSKTHFRQSSSSPVSNLRFRWLDRAHHQLFDVRKDHERAAKLPPHF